MHRYLLFLVMSVFLGTKLLSIPTPVAQMTIYRVLTLGIPLILTYQIATKNKSLKLNAKGDATKALLGFLMWWLYAVISVIWAVNTIAWFQAIFLLSLGVLTIVGLYFWIENETQWNQLIYGVWGMLCTQVLWGLSEILTGKYLFADLSKLDKYRTFKTMPLTRMPITYFANQNDYATMLIAFLAISTICFHRTQNFWVKLTTIVFAFIASYLVYRSGSRMALVVLLLLVIIYFLSQYRLDFSIKQLTYTVAALILSIILIFIVKPNLFEKVIHLILSINKDILSGDGARINLWKNGLIFLSETFGLGVGAGNIETWMAKVPYYQTNTLVNIHNWWLEILVGYGVLSFFIYTFVYYILMKKLWLMTKLSNHNIKYTALGLFVFMATFILSSITSASNMLIEWHWVVFALIISYVNITEVKLSKE